MVLAFGYGAYESFSFGFLAKIFPLYVSLSCLLLALVNLVMEMFYALEQDQDSGVGLVDLETEWEIPMTEVIGRFSRFVALILLLYAAVGLVGYAISITLFMVFFYRYHTGTSWKAALVAGCCGLAFISLISKLMVIDWPSGIMQN